MPLVYQHNINATTKLGIWHITEEPAFFLKSVQVGREITHWHKRLQHLAGRFLLQEMFPGFPYQLIEIATTKKPFLPGEEYLFSISHCGDYAAVIVSTSNRVGIDIEIFTPRVGRIRQKFLSKVELDFHKPHGEHLLTLLWCAKEALFKWYGRGEVDFREHMHLHRVNGTDEGTIEAEFLKEMNLKVDVHFKQINNFCLAWVHT